MSALSAPRPAIPYTTEEAAALLRVHPFTVRRWCERGLLNGRKDPRTHKWLIDPRSVEQRLAAPTPETPAVDQALALLPELSPDERLRLIAQAAHLNLIRKGA